MQTNSDGSVNTYDTDGNKSGTVDAETFKEMTTVNDDVSELATEDDEQENGENGENTEADEATEDDTHFRMSSLCYNEFMNVLEVWQSMHPAKLLNN